MTYRTSVKNNANTCKKSRGIKARSNVFMADTVQKIEHLHFGHKDLSIIDTRIRNNQSKRIKDPTKAAIMVMDNMFEEIEMQVNLV